eukprot:602528-Ditylum_brightwellii.AAC.1
MISNHKHLPTRDSPTLTGKSLLTHWTMQIQGIPNFRSYASIIKIANQGRKCEGLGLAQELQALSRPSPSPPPPRCIQANQINAQDYAAFIAWKQMKSQEDPQENESGSCSSNASELTLEFETEEY